MNLPSAQSAELRVENNGCELALSVDGPDDAVPLLFVHGLGSAQVLWQPWIAELSANYRCWNLDLRGHGASDRVPGGYHADGYASDVVAALDHIGKPVIGIGHSLGGSSITRVAARGHRGLRALYVLDSSILRRPGVASTSAAIFEHQLAMVRQFQAEGRPIEAYRDVLAAAPNPVGGSNAETMVPEQLLGRAESLSQMDPECMAVVVERMTVEGPVAATSAFAEPAVSIPIRVIAADPSMGAAFRPEYAAELVTHAPHAQVRTIEGVGHQLLMMKGFDVALLADLNQWISTL